MEDQARYRLPVNDQVEEILTQAISDVSAQVEAGKERILRESLLHSHPELAYLSLPHLGEYLTVYTFGPGYALYVLTHSGEPVIFFAPETMGPEVKPDQHGCLHFAATFHYVEGHAGAREFYRIRAQYHVMD